MKAIAIVNNIKSDLSSLPPALLDIPDSCMIRSGKPFFIPEFDSDFRAYASVAVRIERLGKCIATRFAERYYSHITAAISMRAENTLLALRREGLPWSEAMVFDRSLILGDFVTKEEFHESGETILVECGERKLESSLSDLNKDIDEVIAYVSSNNTLRTGDVILTGLSLESIPISIETAPCHLHAFIGDKQILSTNIR